jgi:uncharacterized protein GlcG (DUF336 family)
MADTVPHLKLTLAGAQKILAASIAKAEAMGVPQDIAIVDDGGNMLAFARMDGARVLSALSAIAKAKTAASIRNATGGVDPETALKLALAQDLNFTNLRGGLPIVVDGKCLGAIGVGSGTGEQDVECARAGLSALAGAQKF